jgi:hypothetical protein
MNPPDTELAYGQIDRSTFSNLPKPSDALAHLDRFHPSLSRFNDEEGDGEKENPNDESKIAALVMGSGNGGSEHLATDLYSKDELNLAAIDMALGWCERDEIDERVVTAYRRELATLLYWIATLLSMPKTWEERSDVATAFIWCVNPQLLLDGKVSLARIAKSGQCHTRHAAQLSKLTGRIRKELGDIQLHGKMKTAGARAKLCKGQQARRSTESKQPAPSLEPVAAQSGDLQ